MDDFTAVIPVADDEEPTESELKIAEVMAMVWAKARREFDAKIQELRDEIEIKIGLKQELAKLRTQLIEAQAEVAETRKQAPNFEDRLSALQDQVQKLQRTTSRLRGEASQLRYAQEQGRKQVTLTQVRMTAEIGAQTRLAMQELLEQENRVLQ